MAAETTPMLEQYRRLKAEHPDSILLFRMGDFYETFYEDAILASKVLGIALTSRDRNKADSVPLAGVPHHAVDGYLRTLVAHGHSVAIAEQMEAARFGVKHVYLIGSTKNATAGPASDIDLLVHFAGSGEQRETLRVWLEGWSRCLGEVNYLRTGYKSDGLLDVQIITDEDIARKNSYAVKIGAVTDAARELPLKKAP